METFKSVTSSLVLPVWASSIDLKDAYLYIPIRPQDSWFLLYDRTFYEFTTLPLGLPTSSSVPYKKYITKNNLASPWLTRGLLKSVRRKHKLHKLFLRNPCALNEQKYKQYRNRLTVIIRAAKKNYFATSLEKEKNNIKNTWKIINLALNKKTTKTCNTNLFNVNDDTFNKPQSIAKCFNEFFTSIGPKLASKIPLSDVDPINYIKDNYPNSFFLTPITRDELMKYVNKLPTNKSPGHDDFSGFIIKQIAPYIADPLQKIFNLSFMNGV